MRKIAKDVNELHFTMLYGNYCYIFIENFPRNSLRVETILTIRFSFDFYGWPSVGCLLRCLPTLVKVSAEGQNFEQ